jgi:uncharacterized protein
VRVTDVPVKQGLFTDTEPLRLLGSRCDACGRHHFPRHDTCPYCGADAPRPVSLSDRGRLWAWTAVNSAPPGYTGDVPYGFGVVELPEGIRVITRLTVADPAALEAGQPMRLTVVPIRHDDDGGRIVSYAFEPEDRR